MISGVVTGQVWATRRIDGLPAGAFLARSPPAGSPVPRHRSTR